MLLILIGLIVAYAIFAKLIKPVVPLPLINPTPNILKTGTSLKNTVEKTMEEAKGTYGIAIKNLKTGETYYSNEHEVFGTASLYKLWVMAVVYKQIRNGQLAKDQVLSEDVAVLNQKFSIDPEFAEQTEGTITFTVHAALNQMITISHNYAAMLLSEKIKLSTVADFLKDNKFSESSIGTDSTPPKSTASDIALFYEKLYKGKLADKEYTDEMISLLRNQQLNNGLPKYLPDEISVAHKTGEIDFLKHDAGIVFTDKGDYIIIIMSESDSPAGAQERIALVSKAVYDYFNEE